MSDALAARAHLGEHDIDAVLVDGAQSVVGKPQAHPAVLALDPETAALQVGHEAPLGLVVRVRNVIAHHRGFSGDLADSSHRSLLGMRLCRSKAGDYRVKRGQDQALTL